jgi:hypothetical protein
VAIIAIERVEDATSFEFQVDALAHGTFWPAH